MRTQVYEDAARLVTKFAGGAVIGGATLGERQIRVVVSTPTPDRVGDILEPGGCDLKSYLRNPVVLRDHDRTRPVGTASVEIKPNRVEALITFASPGVSECADETCALMKSGVLSAVSPGFIIMESSPLKGGGLHIKKWQLLEISCCAVPANAEAIVTERSLNPDAEMRRREIEILRLKLSPDEIRRPSPADDHAQRERELARLREQGKQIARDVRDLATATPAGAAAFLRKQEEHRALGASRRFYQGGGK